MAEIFQTIPFETDPNDLAQDSFDYLGEQIPGWEPTPGDLLTIAVESESFLLAELFEIASDIGPAVFRHLGAKLHNLPPIEASYATGESTWTMIDDAGYTIPEGTQVSIASNEGDALGFEVASEVEVANGDTVTATGEVILRALEPGAAGSGLSDTPELVDSLAYVDSIVLEGITTGGVDAETDSDYLDRLSQEFETLAPRPIIPRDFEIMARSVAGVDRAVALDGYNPDDETDDNERMIHLVIVDENGEPLGSTIKDAVDDLLQAQREVNFVVTVGDPTYTDIDVVFTATSYADFDAADVEAQAEAAVTDYLDPKNWGQPRFGEHRLWVNDTKVRIYEIVGVLEGVEGLNHVTNVEVAEAGDPSDDIDINLTGAAPLPRPATVNGTVS